MRVSTAIQGGGDGRSKFASTRAESPDCSRVQQGNLLLLSVERCANRLGRLVRDKLVAEIVQMHPINC